MPTKTPAETDATPVFRRQRECPIFGARFLNTLRAGAVGTILLFLICANVRAQELPALNVTPSEYDSYLARQAGNVRHHARPANTEAGRQARPSQLSNMHSNKPSANNSAPLVTRYPGDLEYQGGTVVESTQMHLIYVNLASSTSCSRIATCWGNPRQFLDELGESHFIHVVDQYVGSTQDNRYTVNNRAIQVSYPTTSKPLTDTDMVTIVHAVAMSLRGTPTGYGNLYHIFLVPGQDECFDSTYTQCYSPDNPAAWVFCAYHGSADFTDIGHVLYSVEPFQDNSGCSVRPGTPNGQLTDSTNNVLSHETFETITDPDGMGWWNSLDNGLFGQEIGDECSFLLSTSTAVYFDPANVTLDGQLFVAQPEYNNSAHACTNAP